MKGKLNGLWNQIQKGTKDRSNSLEEALDVLDKRCRLQLLLDDDANLRHL